MSFCCIPVLVWGVWTWQYGQHHQNRTTMTATAHKLARIVYSLLKHGTEYSDAGQDYYERLYQARLMRNLQQRAKALGIELVPAVVEPAVT